jgi:hypothetical protein
MQDEPTMIKIPDPVLILYIVASVLGFLFRFIKDGVYKQLTIKPLVSNAGLFLLVFLPFLGLLFLAQHFSVTAGSTVPYFAGAACLSYLLSGLGLPSYLRGILLAGAGVALTSFVQTDFIGLASALTGLLAVKLTENLGFAEKPSLDDILPPFIWLTSVMWITTLDLGKDLPLKAGLILGIMAVSMLMRVLQTPFLIVGKSEDDKLFLKRLLLAVTAGLGVLCVIVKLLNLVHFETLAIICAAGFFITYIYKDLSGDESYSLAGVQGLRMLIFIGLMTLVASRLYGSYGLLALAPTAMVAPLSTAALLPGIFYCSRVLLQVYLQHFNMNVTGINLTHTYAGAAQYGGFLLGIAILLLLKEKMNKRVILSLALATCIITPVLSNFLLHSEPTCSLFAAAIVSAFILAVIGPSLQNSTSDGVENLSLTPALMISSGILTSGLLELGNEATRVVKGTVLSYGVIFLVLFTFVFWFFFQRKRTVSPPPATSTDSPA